MSPGQPEEVSLDDAYNEDEDTVEAFGDSGDPVAAMPGPRQLMSLDEALKRIPESLTSEMKELLRADFREVRRLKRKPRG